MSISPCHSASKKKTRHLSLNNANYKLCWALFQVNMLIASKVLPVDSRLPDDSHVLSQNNKPLYVKVGISNSLYMVSLMIKTIQAISELCRLQKLSPSPCLLPSSEIAYRIFNPLFPYIHFSMDFVMLLMIYHSQKIYCGSLFNTVGYTRVEAEPGLTVICDWL